MLFFFFFFWLNHETSKTFLDLMGSKCIILCPQLCTHTLQGAGDTGQETVAQV